MQWKIIYRNDRDYQCFMEAWSQLITLQKPKEKEQYDVTRKNVQQKTCKRRRLMVAKNKI